MNSQHALLPLDTGAKFSDCRTWRYTLWRRWADGPAILWLLLNPSTATETSNDPTVERCQRRAQAAGYAAVFVANIFALRSTDPRGLYSHPDPVGPDNDAAIAELAGQASLVVCGWGNHGVLNERSQQMTRLLRSIGTTPHCLRMTGAGQPGHPLYIGYGVTPVPMLGFGAS